MSCASPPTVIRILPPPGSGFPVSPALFSPSRAPPEANCPTASREPIAIHIRHFAPFYRAHWYRFSLEFRIRLCVIAAEKVSPHLPGKPPAPTVRAGPLLASGRALLRAASALRPTGDSVFVFTRRLQSQAYRLRASGCANKGATEAMRTTDSAQRPFG
ncbi:hypothetical protein QR680_005582 [Steinernema hermaphroditum]|uniref:Uncharacterized protein n=1 Tax=Steinernema hermaphroditum TaxID=289476 RepID=A0AA39LVY1_9BILA|nr:hypothetical protein QR680_005582 [Steinernema hermaphroditum]